jgi:transcription-repair coupling factor (superfamily II helicase)
MQSNILSCILSNDIEVLVGKYSILDNIFPNAKTFKNSIIYLEIGKSIEFTFLEETLLKNGYNRVSLVEEWGEYSIRGGIIDVFSFGEEFPVRCEFDGNKLVSLRKFNVVTQTSECLLNISKIVPQIQDCSSNELEYFEKDIFLIFYEPHLIKINKNLNYKSIEISSLILPDNELRCKISSTNYFQGNLNLFGEEIKNLKRENYKINFIFNNCGEKERFIEILEEKNLLDNLDYTMTIGYYSSGFIWHDMKIAFFPHHEIFKRYITKPYKFIFKGQPVKDYMELTKNDFVVHRKYGIGKFLGIVRMKIDDVEQDFLSIEYANNEKLYVPIDNFSLVHKYIGKENPQLNQLSKSNWERTKQKIKEKAKELANELLKIYATRAALPGYQFSKDTIWQKEFESSFIYEDTPDQIVATKNIKSEMEKPIPMDYLLCGDVGFGKTEVAMRAAFKAVMDKKQVAVLAPTTVLVEQHYNTFKERMADYPITIKFLSRFLSKSEQKKIIEEIKIGKIDIIIGTHRLLQNDVVFKDLGLIIIDDEHKFGVKDKEKLKKVYKTVDVLSLTATPIPRTLYIGLSGIRPMSILTTPPEGRLPIETFIIKFDEEIIKEAIYNELARNGQVFYICNSIELLPQKEKMIKNLVKEAKIAIAHGKMKSYELEKVMLEFIHQKKNVLLTTTIIEAGIDIPNANTIIIEDAHKFGLAQLYQLRGRIGRSKRKAYAYLTYPPSISLSQDEYKRLAAISSARIGSGFHIAVKDMEIRGAGNILGKEQHGHIQAVGFELYCELLKEAVAELKGEKVYEEKIPEISLKVDAYIPQDYVSDDGEKISLYKRMGEIKKLEELNEFKNELIDRYGNIPKEVNNLCDIIHLKIVAKEKNISLIKEDEKNIRININGEIKYVQKQNIEELISFIKNYF